MHMAEMGEPVTEPDNALFLTILLHSVSIPFNL